MPEQGVAAGQVVPGDRPVGPEPDELQVGLEGPVVVALGGQVVGVDPEGVGVERVAFEDPAEEVELELELALLAEPPRRGLRDRALGRGRPVDRGLRTFGDAPFPAWIEAADAVPAARAGRSAIR